jgi:hypothetical protein
MAEVDNNIFNKENDKIGQKINPMPVPETNIGVDTDNDFFKDIANLGDSSSIDITTINSFSQLSNSRETLYQVLDTMAQDSTVSAILEIYAEDATEQNEQGQTVWVESDDANIAKYVTFLLNSLNVEKNIYRWVYSLCKYGDLYLKLFRQSDFDDDLLKDEDKSVLNEKFNNISEVPSEKQNLDENVIVKAYRKDDRLVNFVEMVYNPGEMFELTKFGKSYAYIKTNTLPVLHQQDNPIISSYYLYKMRKRDVEVYNAVSYVHAALTDDTPRIPEQVQIFNGEDLSKDSDSNTYTVNRGQSLLFSSYKIWRQMMLLENALLLNRLTKSSILRVIEVEVADMPKERVQPYLQRVKTLVEQKTSLSDGDKISEYTNPGSMENNIYVPTRGGIGAINTQQIGGDVNVKDIADIDYFKNKFYGSMKIPKQYLGDTDDATGFNGGTSLSIVSSRYAKTVKRVQATIRQMLTDVVNILLIDRGLDSYVNKFTLQMQEPVTQEELDKRDSLSSEIQITDDLMRMVGDIEDPIIKLKILKALLSKVISNQEVISLIQETIESLESANEEQTPDAGDDEFGDDDLFGDIGGGSGGAGMDSDFDFGDESDFGDIDNDVGGETDMDTSSGDSLPSPADLSAGDFTEL